MAVRPGQKRASERRVSDSNCWRCLCGGCVLAAAMCAASPKALAQDADPYEEEWSDVFEGETIMRPEEGETAPQGAPPAAEDAPEEEEAEEDLPLTDDRRMTGAEARRELLFREGLDEREFRYPRGLEPAPPVERGDPQVYDPRYRGRNAQVLAGIRPGLTVNGSVSAGMFVDTNPTLLGDEEAAGVDTEAWGWFVEPQLAVARRTPRTLFQGVLRLPYDDFNSFEGDASDDLGSFDQYAGLQFDMYGREDAVNVFTNISNSTTRTAIVEETGEDLSGRRALTYGGGGSFKHTLTPDSVVQFSASARRQNLETDGDDGVIDGTGDDNRLQDSTFYQLALDFRKLISRTDSAGLGASYAEFLPEGLLDPDIRIITALASWSRNVSSSLNFLLEGGAQIITAEEIEGLTASETSLGPYIEASLYWGATDRDSFLFTYALAAEPTGAGEVRTNNRVEVQYNRELTKRVAVGIPLLVIFQNETFRNEFENRTFFQASPNLVWVFTPSWGLSLEYRFRLDNEANRGTATSNAAFLSLSYFGRLVP